MNSKLHTTTPANKPSEAVGQIGDFSNLRLEIDKMTNEERMWHFYKRAHITNPVRRGFEVYGVTKTPEQRFDSPLRKESVDEHQYDTVTIAKLMLGFYPDLLPADMHERCFNLLHFHDIGERIIGDIPDDTLDHTEKDEHELSAFVDETFVLPGQMKDRLRHDFIGLQGPRDHVWSAEEQKLYQFSKCADKVSALLRMLIYEMNGAPGSIFYKRASVGSTELDEHYMRITNDPTFLGVLIPHFFDQYHEYYSFRYWYELVRVAVIDVRGTWVDWLERLCQTQDIDPKYFP